MTLGPNKKEECFDIWHYKLGHPSSFKKIVDVNLEKSGCCKLCNICPLAKMHRLSFGDSTSRAKNVFDLIHCDV